MEATPRPQGSKIKVDRLIYDIQHLIRGISFNFFNRRRTGRCRDQTAIHNFHVLVKLTRWRWTAIQYLSLSDGKIEALANEHHGVLHGLQNFGLRHPLGLAFGRSFLLLQGGSTVGRFQRLAKENNLRSFLGIGLLQLGHPMLTQLQLGRLRTQLLFVSCVGLHGLLQVMAGLLEIVLEARYVISVQFQ